MSWNCRKVNFVGTCLETLPKGVSKVTARIIKNERVGQYLRIDFTKNNVKLATWISLECDKNEILGKYWKQVCINLKEGIEKVDEKECLLKSKKV